LGGEDNKEDTEMVRGLTLIYADYHGFLKFLIGGNPL
jgi:hypothetical protein